MYLLHLDHAGAVEDPSQKHFVLAGIAVFERQTYWLSQELEKIAATPADPPAIELQGSPMHGGRGEWRKFPLVDRIRALSDALAVIVKSHPSNTLSAFQSRSRPAIQEDLKGTTSATYDVNAETPRMTTAVGASLEVLTLRPASNPQTGKL